MFASEGLKVLFQHPLIGIPVLLLALYFDVQGGKKSTALKVVSQARGAGYLLIFGIGAIGALLAGQPLLLAVCVGLAVYGVFEMISQEGPSPFKSALSTLRLLKKNAGNEAPSALPAGGKSTCCPHCAADFKPIGTPGLCWHCQKSLPR
jgi:hypothetical protein